MRSPAECDLPEAASPVQSPASPSDMNRVHEELEKLNIATDVINKLELQLDEAQAVFRDVQSSWTQKLAQMSKRLGSCIEKSRPYYEARFRVLEAQQEAHKAALRFERANRMHSVAKQQVNLTQEGLNRQGTENIDPACLEVLNHHIQRVNEAEIERLQSEEEHRNISKMVEEATGNVFTLENSLKRSIQKSKTYFEARVEFTKVLQNQKSLILRLEGEIRQKKADYNGSLRRLEEISEEIHEKRNSKQALSSARSGSCLDGAEKDERASDDGSTTGVSSKLPDVCLGSASGSGSTLTLSKKTKRTEPDLIEAQPVADPAHSVALKSSPALLIYPLPAQASSSIGRSLSSGIILLAHELIGPSHDGSKFRAFQFPPEELDVEYKTNPEGLTDNDDSVSYASSENFVLKVLQDDQVKEMMESPERLMDDIKRVVDDAKSASNRHC